jgi:uncharacterized protein YggU (UPF0235/DUF167 family)
VSGKPRIVILDRAALTQAELPIPRFDHTWSEYPGSDTAEVVPRLFWATLAITHACPIDAETIGQLHKLGGIVVTVTAMPRVVSRLKIAAPAVDNRANALLLAWLAVQLGVPKTAVRLVRGESSRRKTVAVPVRAAPSAASTFANMT